ncbi:hypothetical protein TNCT_53871 [Trichonephila clavata]|uniref:Uncharacterized protein n=1 Tax=Trichonephila clavata TaxID=2740835 RepID=A0A8X6JND1_TRICU|nr:hypothetical protein TNCT_53871 [Trichonephila clavata]
MFGADPESHSPCVGRLFEPRVSNPKNGKDAQHVLPFLGPSLTNWKFMWNVLRESSLPRASLNGKNSKEETQRR